MLGRRSRQLTALPHHRMWLFLLALLPFLTGFGPPVISDGAYPPVRLSSSDIARLIAASRPPAVTAASALVLDLDSGTTLYAYRPDLALPPASTAKIMTALVVLSQAPVGDVVTISALAAGTEGSRMGLTIGETLTVEELLYGLLLPSGNDAAVALAEHLSGTQEAFVAEMNRRAGQMGLMATHFDNPHGLDAPGQTSSATDLVALARAALAYPVFARVVATPRIVVAGRELQNTNELLGVFPGVDGVKTGTTDNAGECLVVALTQEGHRILAVVLGSTDRYGDMRALLTYASAGWEWLDTALPDNALAWAVGPDGRRFRLRSSPTSDIFVPAWQLAQLQPLRVLTATVPLTSTLPVGELRWNLNGKIVASVPLHVWQGP